MNVWRTPRINRLSIVVDQSPRVVTRQYDVVKLFEGVLEILCQFFNVQHNAVRRIDNDRQIRF